MEKREKTKEYPTDTTKDYLVTLDNGKKIINKFIDCPELGIHYFKEVVNTGRFVVSWEPVK